MTEAPLTFHPSAIEEASAAYHWYKERDSSAATALLAEMDRAVDHIRRFPFVIVYRQQGAATEVVAVAHGRRRPGYWKSR